MLFCNGCGGATKVLYGQLVHADTESVQCVSAEHCTRCGHIVDYSTVHKAWVHDDTCVRPGVVPEGLEIPAHDPEPEYGGLLSI